MPIKIKCPACHAKLNIADRKAGQKIACPTCDEVFRVPKKKLTPKSKKKPPKKEKTIPSEEVEEQEQLDIAHREMTPEERSIAPTASFDIFEDDDEDEFESEPNDSADASLLDDLFENEDFEAGEIEEPIKKAAEEKPEAEKEPEPEVIHTQEDQSIEEESFDEEPEEEEISSEERNKQRDQTEAKLVEVLARKRQKQRKHPRKKRDEDDEDDEDGFQLRSSNSEFEEMDLTPMVDVTFLLLVFFMITASFSLQKSLEVPPPDPNEKGAASAPSLEDLEKESIMVEIDEEDQIIVDDEPLADRSDLISRLEDVKREDNLKREIIINANTKSRNETLVYVIDAANDVKMQRIRLASSGDDTEQ